MRCVSVAVCLVCVLGPSRPTAAQQPIRTPRVRPESADLRELMDEAGMRSSTIRALVDEIARTDVIVYIRVRLFATSSLDGRIGFLGATPTTRFLAIEIACARARDAQIVTLAHELQHAVEIARAPWVDGVAGLARYYAQIGSGSGTGSGSRTFETQAAVRVAAQVRHEISARGRRAGQ